MCIRDSIKTEFVRMEVLSNIENFIYNKEVQNQFLKFQNEVSVQNLGNVRNTQSVRVPVSYLEYMFSSGDFTKGKDSENYYFVWETTISGSEMVKVNYETNYRPISLFLFLTVLFSVSYYLTQSPLRVYKKVESLGESGKYKVCLLYTSPSPRD